MSTLQRGVAFTIQTVCYDMVTPTDPINVATQISKDGGPFVATTNAPSVTSPGLVTVALTAAEMTCDRFAIKVTSSNLEPHIVPYYTEDSYTGDRAARLDATVSSRAPSGEYDTPMANLDAKVSSRSTLTATEVWGNPGRTLTSFGTLVSDIATAVWSSVVRTITGGKVDTVDGQNLANLDVPVSTRAVPGDKMDLVTAINSAALDTLNNAITVTLTQQDIEDLVDGIAQNLDTIVSISQDSIAQIATVVLNGLAGLGEHSVTIPVLYDTEDEPEPIAGLSYRAIKADGTLVSWWHTDSAGNINLLLDEGTYYIWIANSANYDIDNPYEYVVDVAGVYDPIVLQPIQGALTPVEPGLCSCFIDVRYAAGEKAGVLVGAKEAWIDVLDVSGRGTATPFAPEVGELPLAALTGERAYSDAHGRIEFLAIRGVDLRISLTRPWSVNEKQLTNSIQFTVPDAAHYNIEFDG